MCIKIFFISLVLHLVLGDKPCIPKLEKYGSFVCICNSTYCDEISEVEKLPSNSFVIYSSSKAGLRFHKENGKLKKTEPEKFKQASEYSKKVWFNELMELMMPGNHDDDSFSKDIILSIDRSKKFQTIKGFGGGFTDSASMKFHELSEKSQQNILNSYFSEKGLEYNLGRVPIAGTDFSEQAYAYDDQIPEGDPTLSKFTLSKEDFDYKIPFIKKALKTSKVQIKLIASAWSSPAWMKSNHQLTGISQLLPEYYQTWADYHIRFLEEYEKQEISYWAITTGNVPLNGILPIKTFNSLGWIPSNQAQWIVENFGPTIRKSKFSDIKILGLEDQRIMIPIWLNLFNRYPELDKYIDGIALQWYLNHLLEPSWTEKLHDRLPNKFIMSTESCIGNAEKFHVKLGSWERGEIYLKDIIEDLNHWYTSWLDWNLLLDEDGGPNWNGNSADAPIIAYTKSDEFVKQPMYYAIGHFSKFIPKGSIRVFVKQLGSAPIENVAFLRPDGGIVIVFYNRLKTNRTVTLEEIGKGYVTLNVPPKSIHSVLYW